MFIPQARILKVLSRCLNLITGLIPPFQPRIGSASIRIFKHSQRRWPGNAFRETIKQSLTFQHSVHYLATHPPGIEEIRRLTFRYSGQKKSTYQDSLLSSAHSYIFTCHLHPPRPVSSFLRTIVFCLPSVAHSDLRHKFKEIFRCHLHLPSLSINRKKENLRRKIHISSGKETPPYVYKKFSSKRVQHTWPFENPLARCWKLIHRLHSSCSQAQVTENPPKIKKLKR